MEGTLPRAVHPPPRVLRRLGPLAKISEHRIDPTLQRRFPRANHALKARVVLRVLQPLELLVRVEHERRPREPPRRTRAPRMESDDEERGGGEAEGKMRIRRIGADRRVPRVARRIGIMQMLKRLPQSIFECRLVDDRWLGEAR